MKKIVFALLILTISIPLRATGPSYLTHSLKPIGRTKNGVLFLASQTANPMGAHTYMPISYYWVYANTNGSIQKGLIANFNPDYDKDNITKQYNNFQKKLDRILKGKNMPASFKKIYLKYRWLKIPNQKKYRGSLKKYLK